MEKVPRVGVGVMLCQDNKVLLLKRKGAHGEGTWAFIGGNLDFMEDVIDCAKREVEEEIGVKVESGELVAMTNDIFEKEDKHYVTLLVLAKSFSGIPEIKEEDKIIELKWFAWDEFPENLFVPLTNLRNQGFNPFNV